MTDHTSFTYRLVSVKGGCKIEKLSVDHAFDPPIAVPVGYLNGGRRFASREAARDFMIRRQARERRLDEEKELAELEAHGMDWYGSLQP